MVCGFVCVYRDFHIWTFAYDVSGIDKVVLHYRVDKDGVNPLEDFANELFQTGKHVK